MGVRAEHLRSIPRYAPHVNTLTPFDVYVLDKVEAALTDRPIADRQWAEEHEITSLFLNLGLTVLFLIPRDNLIGSRWYTALGGEDLTSAHVMDGRLRERCPDLFLLRWDEGVWDEGRYQHFATVSYGDLPAWRCLEVVSTRAANSILALPEVQALQAGDFEGVRDMLLDRLRPSPLVNVGDGRPSCPEHGRPSGGECFRSSFAFCLSPLCCLLRYSRSNMACRIRLV